MSKNTILVGRHKHIQITSKTGTSFCAHLQLHQELRAQTKERRSKWRDMPKCML